ncbi:MAG: hypothetical protein LC776_02770, partial [Acidobacteria bacterium]|nr:hypothetical protein [Acidobacteriota bacterium]
VVTAERGKIRSIWSQARAVEPQAVVPPLEELLSRGAGLLLAKFYPETSDLFSGEGRAKLIPTKKKAPT